MLFRRKREKLLVEQVNAAQRRIDELAEQHHHLQQALGQQQAHSDRERASLHETFAGHIAELRGLVLLQRSQQESVVALVNEHYHQLRADLTTQLTSQGEQIGSRLHELETALAEQRQVVEQVVQLLSTQAGQLNETFRLQRRELEVLLERSTAAGEDALQRVRQEVITTHTVLTHRIEQNETRLAHLTTHAQAFDGVVLEWQQRADLYEQHMAAAQDCLQEELQARKASAQPQALRAVAKELQQPPKQPMKSNGAILHAQP
jgi:hypothetical protein